MVVGHRRATTSDVGMLMNGFPRESAVSVDIGGVRTNFRMPDVLAIGLGGGAASGARTTARRIGPDSVGYELTEKGTGLRRRHADHDRHRGGRGPCRYRRPPARRSSAGNAGRDRRWPVSIPWSDEAVDRMKTSAEPMPVILVGGGSGPHPPRSSVASKLIRPDHASVRQRDRRGHRPGRRRGRTGSIRSRARAATRCSPSAKSEAIARAMEAGAARIP